MADAEVTLPSTTASVATARRFVEDVLVSWGLAGLGWEAAMVVSELATNATLHAPGLAFVVHVHSRDDGSVRLEVTDTSLRLPQQRSHSATSTTGRGLRIVTEVSCDWGVDLSGGGKTVWAELLAGGPPRELTDDVDLNDLLLAFREPADETEGPSGVDPAGSTVTLLVPRRPSARLNAAA